MYQSTKCRQGGLTFVKLQREVGERTNNAPAIVHIQVDLAGKVLGLADLGHSVEVSSGSRGCSDCIAEQFKIERAAQVNM